MVMTRFQLRNQYALADKELYRTANKDDCEAVLQATSMAGLVGVLRQLGDLAEFAAEVFHCLHEKLMTTAARGNGLATRLQHLETEFRSIQTPFLSQTDHSPLLYDPGLEWHPNLQTKEILIAPSNLPRCIMHSYEECRGPPQLFVLDKFDANGYGSCLKRYSDPSLLRTRTASAVVPTSKLSKDERICKQKKKVSHATSGDSPVDSRTSHAKLHQLFSLERVDNTHKDPKFHVKLKRRQLSRSPIKLSCGTWYMEKFVKNSSSYCERVDGTLDQPSPTLVAEVTVHSVREDLPISSLGYPNNEDHKKYVEMEVESIDDDERLEIPFVPQEIAINEKLLGSKERGPTICLERSSSLDSCCKTNNDAYVLPSMASEANEADSDDKDSCNLGFPGFGRITIYTNADVTQTEEGESSLTDIPISSPEIQAHKVNPVDIGTFGLDETSFSLHGVSGSKLEHQYNKANDNEIGLKSSEACEMCEGGSDSMLSISQETHMEHLSELAQVPLEGSEGVTKANLTNNTEDHHFQHVFSVEIGSGNFEELSFAGDNGAQTNETNSSSMNMEQTGEISPFEIGYESGTFMLDTSRNLYTGSGDLSVSSWPEDRFYNHDMAETEISSYPEQEDPQTTTIVAYDSNEAEVPIPDTQRHDTCFGGDDDYKDQTDNKVPEIEMEYINDQEESLLGDYDYGQEIPSKIGSANLTISGSTNLISASAKSLPYRVLTKDAHFGVHENISEMSVEHTVPFSMLINLHETPLTDPEITPPFLPLPPTQWWMEKHVKTVKATQQEYPSEVYEKNHSFHVYTEDSTLEDLSSYAQTTLNEPSRASEEQSLSIFNETNDESKPKGTNKTWDQAKPKGESAEGLEADWRSEAIALEWFSQNLKEHNDPRPAKLGEESQRGHPLEPPNETETIGNVTREKNSLVIGIDRSMVTKVSERKENPLGPRVEENDSVLEIIRSKSFNLRRTYASVRPNLQVAVPVINLKVTSILEKVNALRQAMAGSDEERDSDSWSE